MNRSEQDRQRDLDIIIEERAAENQEQRLHLWLPVIPYIFPFAFFLLIGHFFCKMIGVEPRSVSNEIALFTLTGGAASLFILIKSKQWEKYKNEIMPPLILTILLIFVFVAIFRAH